MGRHGASNASSSSSPNFEPPIDTYRRRIGRQDSSKKEKRHFKALLSHQQSDEVKKETMSQIVLIVITVFSLVLAIYAFLFYALN